MKPASVKPPRLAIRFFEWCCPPTYVEDIHGDIDEIFYNNLRRMSPFKAKLLYWIDVISLSFSYAVKRRKQRLAVQSDSFGPLHPVMVRNYVAIAIRNIDRHKIYSIINVLGLGLGVSACMIIYLIANHELSFDKFHPDQDRIYRLVIEDGPADDKRYIGAVPAPVPMAVREEVPGLEVVAAFHGYAPKIKIPTATGVWKKFQPAKDQIAIVDPDFFGVFHYDWLIGSAADLGEPFKVVISEKKARDYFGPISPDNVVGKEIIYDDSIRVTVTGIVKDWTERTDFPMTDFISFSTIAKTSLKNDIVLDNWGRIMHGSLGFVKIEKGSSTSEVTRNLTALMRRHDIPPDNQKSKIELKLQPLADIHFNAGYQPSPSLLPTLYALAALAIFILVIAAINFVNLSTAQSFQRVKEIGIRKVLGSMRSNLIYQFLIETALLTTVSVVIALLLVTPLIGALGDFVPDGLRYDLFSPSTFIFAFTLIIGTALLAGYYPARVISSHSPATSMRGKGSHNSSGNNWLRKALIVFQFSISLFFIIGTLVIGNQVEFIRNTNKGFVTDDVITTRFPSSALDKPKAVADRVRQLAEFDDVMLQGTSPMGFAQVINSFDYKGKIPMVLGASVKSAGEHYITFYGIHLLAGRNIAEGDSLKEFVINRKMMEGMGFKKPEQAIGEFLYYNDKAYPIVGVVENFNETSFHQPIGPCVMGNFDTGIRTLAMKFPKSELSAQRKEAMMKVEAIFKQFYPDDLFQAHYIDEEIDWMHDTEQKTGRLMRVAMVVTIFISCMGIFGLSLFTTKIRTKEIGIRKVLGASVSAIVTLLNRDFVVLIAIAFGVAAPISWYFAQEWLQTFTYRIDLNIGVFVIAGFSALIIGLICISFQTVRAALANPTDSLRAE